MCFINDIYVYSFIYYTVSPECLPNGSGRCLRGPGSVAHGVSRASPECLQSVSPVSPECPPSVSRGCPACVPNVGPLALVSVSGALGRWPAVSPERSPSGYDRCLRGPGSMAHNVSKVFPEWQWSVPPEGRPSVSRVFPGGSQVAPEWQQHIYICIYIHIYIYISLVLHSIIYRYVYFVCK